MWSKIMIRVFSFSSLRLAATTDATVEIDSVIDNKSNETAVPNASPPQRLRNVAFCMAGTLARVLVERLNEIEQEFNSIQMFEDQVRSLLDADVFFAVTTPDLLKEI